MKKVILSILTASASLQVIAQVSKTDYLDNSELSRCVIDVNLPIGLSNQNYTTPNSAVNYPNAVNANTGKLKFKNGFAYGADAQFGFFFGEKRRFGIGTGFMYLMQQGDAKLDNFHVEYQGTDFAGNTYRQVITGDNLKENLMITNLNIPLVFKYRDRLSRRWGVTGDLGILYNLQMQNKYTTHATFDYEAIYKLETSGDGTISVYDNAPIPAANDWLITKAEFLKNNPNGNIQDYFNTKRALGYNVGLNVPAMNTKGTVSYKTGTVGFIIQPAVNYYLSDFVALNAGVFFLFQPFKNNTSNTYQLTNEVGNYNSSLKNVSKVNNMCYGINLGVRFFIGKKHAPLVITSVEEKQPTACGINDGTIILNGLRPDKPVTVNYKLNDTQPVEYSSTVQADGKVKVDNLSAGNYTDIVVTIKKQTATAQPVTLSNPPLVCPLQTTTNPSGFGVCDGSVVFNGLTAGSNVTISYNLNGSYQPPYTDIVSLDKSVTMGNLCEGKYSDIVVKTNSCSSNCGDFALIAPAAVTIPTPAEIETKPPTQNIVISDGENTENIPGIDISTPILFDLNKAIVHEGANSEIDEAARLMKKDRNATMRIDGHCDTTGPERWNRVLSLMRANAVKQKLEHKGIGATRIKAVGHGSTIPYATNRTREGRKKNRRAVMTLIPSEKDKMMGKNKEQVEVP